MGPETMCPLQGSSVDVNTDVGSSSALQWQAILLEGNGEAPNRLQTQKLRRLQSLDVARGVTIALMIFVDFCGDSWPGVDHTAWNGIRLADFVMPSFDVIVGVAIAFSMKQGRLQADKKQPMLKAALWRSVKLFVLGMLTQAGTAFPTFDLKHIRIMGILQRVALCYASAASAEILLPEVQVSPLAVRGDHLRLIAQRAWHWALMSGLVAIWCILTYGVDPGGCGRGRTDPECKAH